MSRFELSRDRLVNEWPAASGFEQQWANLSIKQEQANQRFIDAT